MRGRLTLLALLGAVFVLGGCFLAAETCFHPITSSVPLAAVRPPLAPTAPVLPKGPCGKWVRYAGQQYTESSVIGVEVEDWSLTAESLDEIGIAESATAVAGPFRSEAVYAIDGIDPAQAVAMLRGDTAGGGIIVMVASEVDPPTTLCQYLSHPPPDTSNWCDPSAESP
jgi:hypothetical protein